MKYYTFNSVDQSFCELKVGEDIFASKKKAVVNEFNRQKKIRDGYVKSMTRLEELIKTL